MRLGSDGFQPCNVITLSSSYLQLFTVTMAHAEKYSTGFTSPFRLGYIKVSMVTFYVRC